MPTGTTHVTNALTMWRKDGTVECDGCGAQFDYPGPRTILIASARAHGWHIYRGLSLVDKEIDSALCEECVGSPRKRDPKVTRFDDEVPLF
jgi:hypothetical protein